MSLQLLLMQAVLGELQQTIHRRDPAAAFLKLHMLKARSITDPVIGSAEAFLQEQQQLVFESLGAACEANNAELMLLKLRASASWVNGEAHDAWTTVANMTQCFQAVQGLILICLTQHSPLTTLTSTLNSSTFTNVACILSRICHVQCAVYTVPYFVVN